jgi:hypothetical protein
MPHHTYTGGAAPGYKHTLVCPLVRHAEIHSLYATYLPGCRSRLQLFLYTTLCFLRLVNLQVSMLVTLLSTCAVSAAKWRACVRVVGVVSVWLSA